MHKNWGHSIALNDEPGEQCQGHASHVIHAPGLDTTLDIPRELSLKYQILSADRA
jgi:hypothetical protein